MDEILNIVRDSLRSIDNPRFFETERGYQGELVAEIRNRLPHLELEGAVVEQEYQKRMKEHGFRIRPDIIIHIPYENTNFTSRSEGNFVVIELKHNASEEAALSEYKNLSRMCKVFDYPMAIFINISSHKTHIDRYQGENKEKLYAFSVQINNGHVQVEEENAT